MNIVIMGLGKVGASLAEQLAKEGHDIIAVDNSAAAVKKVVEEYDIKGVVGNGANYDTQKEAGVEDSDLLIACTSSDELNILCCMVAKKLGAKDTIARIRNPEYFTLFMGKELGLSMMVNPEYETAMEIFRILRFPAAAKVEPFGGGKLELVEFKITKDNPLNKLSLLHIRSKFPGKYLVCAVQRKDELIIPRGDFVLAEGDKIDITGSPKEINSLFKALGILKGAAKKVMIVGGGKIAFYLASELKAMGHQIKIIEKDEMGCHKLADMLSKVEIIHGDGTEQQVLIQEGLLRTDAFIALTDNDEQNIVISLFADGKGVKKVIAKVNTLSFHGMLDNSGVESIVSPKLITASIIARYVRGKENSMGSSVSTLYSIANEKAEALEFNAKSSFSGLNIPLKDLSIKDNILIASILRNNTVITPTGSDTIQDGDSVIVVSSKQILDDLEDILN